MDLILEKIKSITENNFREQISSSLAWKKNLFILVSVNYFIYFLVMCDNEFMHLALSLL